MIDYIIDYATDAVALRKESVDRNFFADVSLDYKEVVALRKESVDRNSVSGSAKGKEEKSLSARRAWIEMIFPSFQLNLQRSSLSARRAWIEITMQTRIVIGCVVALRKESVDRNVPFDVIRPAIDVALRKESVDRNLSFPPVAGSLITSLSARRAWIEIRHSRYCRYWSCGRSPQGERG